MNWKLIGVVLGFLSQANWGSAQDSLTFFQDVWPIVQQKCTPCHNAGGSAPFPLEHPEDFRRRSTFVKHVIESRYMPPWPADPLYRHFRNENRLDSTELKVLRTWLSGEMADGSAGRKPDLQVNAKPVSKRKSLFLKPGQPFNVPGDGEDRFIYFLLDTKVKKDLHITDVEFQPGNLAVVHHMELLSLPGASFSDPGTSTISDESYFGQGFDKAFGREYTYISGWLPGNQGEHFPQGSGVSIEKGSRLVLMVHYAPSPVDERDFSKVKLTLVNKAPRLRVQSIDLHTPEYMRLPAGTVQSFRNEYLLQRDFNAFAIFPHAHHLCTKMEAYAISPQGDSIPLLRIPHWDFDWQFTYYFSDYIRLPKGSLVVFEAVYDNSSANLENPYSPPREIPASFRSRDEMMELFIWGFHDNPESLPNLNQ